ncbi:MAG: glycerophosphodiester phosphodiesterase [Chitinophagia bacterium]|jgi:glycerophosphoryl diester phosphodiesterase
MHKTKTRSLIIAFLCIFASVMVKSQTQFIDLQGHRGCRGLKPENTIAAMIRAIDLGVTTLEMDVVITRDNKVLLSHDHYMNPDYVVPPEGVSFSSAKDRSHILYQMDYVSVVRWDVGSKGNSKFPQQEKLAAIKPLLSDLIDSVEHYTSMRNLKPVRYNIETKSLAAGDGKFHPAPEEFVDLLMDVVKKGKITKRTTIQSFDKRTLQVMHRKYPKISTSYLISSLSNTNLEGLIQDLGFLPTILSPEYQLVNPDFLNECKAKGLRVVVWTVNESADIKKMAELGVDGIISDYPDRFSVLRVQSNQTPKH